MARNSATWVAVRLDVASHVGTQAVVLVPLGPGRPGYSWHSPALAGVVQPAAVAGRSAHS